ncbi:MAG: flagellar protein FliT [Deltaproteobacteria bacterium]|nr:flagellar protein FliT [Deltaproteobacteria bacterium]
MNIIELLEIKKNRFEQIKALADRQEKLVCDDLIREYLQLFAKRDLIKNEIESDNKNYKYILEKADKKDREKIMSMNKEISEVIESILDVDKRIERLINEKRTEVLDEIKGLKKGRTAVKGYGNKKAQPVPRFIKTVG